MTSYPLTLTVEYEENKPDGIGSSRYDDPHGFAVIRLNGIDVHRVPLVNGSSVTVDRSVLEQAAVRWLEEIARGRLER